MTTGRQHALEQLLATVAEMRDLQTTYFRSRDRDKLIESKAKEREVDALIARLQSRQQELFGNREKS